MTHFLALYIVTWIPVIPYIHLLPLQCWMSFQNSIPHMSLSPFPLSLPSDVFLSSDVSGTGNQSGTSSYTFIIILAENLSEIPAPMNDLVYALLHCFWHLQTKCMVCNFLEWHCPILIVKTHPWEGRWKSYNYHKNKAEHCPWHLLHPSTLYAFFSTNVHTSLHHSNSGSGRWSVYVICGKPLHIVLLWTESVYAHLSDLKGWINLGSCLFIYLHPHERQHSRLYLKGRMHWMAHISHLFCVAYPQSHPFHDCCLWHLMSCAFLVPISISFTYWLILINMWSFNPEPPFTENVIVYRTKRML